MYSIGLDVHKTSTTACVLDEEGTVINTMKVKTSPEGLEKIVEFMKNKEYAVLLETMTYSIPVYRYFDELGIEVYGAHAKYLSMITKSNKKTDDNDAVALARYLRLMKLGELELSLSYIPSREEEDLRSLCRLREEYTKETGDEIRRITSHLDERWKKIPSEFKNLRTKKSRKYLLDAFPDDFTLAFRIAGLSNVIDQSAQLDRMLLNIGKNDKNVILLTSIPGIGIRSAVQLMSSIIDINRFRSIDQFCAYFGIVPCVRDSSGKENHSHITKAGDPMVRAVLNRSAFIHIKNCESSITSLYERKSSVSKKKALTAASHKMLKIIYAVLKGQEPFRL